MGKEKKASAKDGEGAGRGPCDLRKSVQVSVAQASLLACMTERSHGRIASTLSWGPSRIILNEFLFIKHFVF
jgi:hypothetical protein